MFHQLFLAFAWAFGCVAGGVLVETCCDQKTVGGVSYTLVEKGIDTASYGCISNCMYEKDDQPGSRFCFAYGNLEVMCEADKKESRGSEPICDDDLEEFFNDTNRSGPLQLRCCNDENKGNYTNCTDLATCSKICGGNVSCIRPVGRLDYLDQCDIDKNARKSDVETALVVVTKSFCETSGNKADKSGCPKAYDDPLTACCKYPVVYDAKGKCKNRCKCKARCGYATKNKICSADVSGCCGCNTYKTNCASTTCSSSGGFSTAEPVTADPQTDCGQVASNCALCAESAYYNDCAKECKCNCTCKAITDCTGNDALSPWNLCWREYAGCCECTATPNYSECCSAICTTDNGDFFTEINPPKTKKLDCSNIHM